VTTNKATTLNLILRSLGLAEAGSLKNVSKRDLTIILAAIGRLRDKTACDKTAKVSMRYKETAYDNGLRVFENADDPDDAWIIMPDGSKHRLPSLAAMQNSPPAPVKRGVKRQKTACDKTAQGRTARKEDVTPADVDPQQLKKGLKVEAEHSTELQVRKDVALDHLAEFPDYYTRLKRMEDEAKADKTAAQGFLAGYKVAAVDAEYSATAKPDRERLRRQHDNGADTGAAEAVNTDESPEADSTRHHGKRKVEPHQNSEATRMRDMPWVKTRAQELDAANINLPVALENMMKAPGDKKTKLPFMANQQPGAGIEPVGGESTRRVVGSGVEA